MKSIEHHIPKMGDISKYRPVEHKRGAVQWSSRRKVYAVDVTGSIPDELWTLTYLTNLNLAQNYLTGNLSASIGNLTRMQYLSLGINALSGELPKELGLLTELVSFYFDSAGVSGQIPSTFAHLQNMQTMWASDNNLTGRIPDFIGNWSELTTLSNTINICEPNFSDRVGFELQQYGGRDTQCTFPIKFTCLLITSSGGILFQRDNESLGSSSYYVSDSDRFGVSNVGYFAGTNSPQYKFSSTSQFTNTLDSELFQTSRLTASSLRYYGLGLENGNYTVTIQFAEAAILDTRTWKSLGRRIFDIYIQGILVSKDFDIHKAAGAVTNRAVQREFKVQVTENYIDIHLFWAGKGTCCIPTQGTYGPSVSAISAVPEFLGIDSRPYTFSYAELKTATEDFNPENKLGEGGFGPVYKGKLNDGRVIAVKQLSAASHQGKSQFVAEIATISGVQHRNLVKLHGCCIEGVNRLLVYEYLENRSLDQALFGKGGLNLDWPTRYDICLGESRLRIVHRDVKASNILLDSDLIPKISDFGLAKLYDDKKTHISTRVAGTIGYLAPEYAMRGHLTEKADVFAFGVVTLELVSGRPNSDSNLEQDKIYLLEWAWQLHENDRELELVDSILSEFSEEEVKRLIGVALLCTQASPTLRPSMSRVVAMISGDIEVSKTTSRPGYLTDWKFDDTSSFMSDNVTRGTDASHYSSSTSTSRVAELVHSPLTPSKPLLNEIIARALNSIFQKWGISANTNQWNISGELCSGAATSPSINYVQLYPFIKCDCSFLNPTTCHITALYFWTQWRHSSDICKLTEFEDSVRFEIFERRLEGNSFGGPIPSAFLNLTSMTELFLDTCIGLAGDCMKIKWYHSCSEKSFTSHCVIKCGGPQMTLSGNIYEGEDQNLGPASFYVVDTRRWGVSNVGYFAGSNNPRCISYPSSQITNTPDSAALFLTSRISASSLRYYGLGLQNGNYNVRLQFTEPAIASGKTWESLGRRVFDVYIQGNLVLKDFDILKTANGVSDRGVEKEFRAQVTENYMVIHLFWAGKGTCCIPDPEFIPTVSNKPPTTNNKVQTRLIVGVVLKTATEDFNPAHKLGEGGFGPVFKGRLNDGRVIAVKQLSLSSHQGKKQFITEISTILAVQHRNLVKLYGCCIEGDNRLLVYEYLENKSLDKALFGQKSLDLIWPTRYDICLGVARGLAYLHEESRLRIVHRDLKASNVLLDSDLNPKISDFGLAKFYDDNKTHISTRIRDLELVDPRLSEFSEEEVKRIIGISLLCTQTSPVQRPSMSRVVAMLSGDVEVSHVPSKPGYLTDWNINSENSSSSFTSGNPTTGIVNSDYSSWTSISIGTDIERSPPNATDVSHLYDDKKTHISTGVAGTIGSIELHIPEMGDISEHQAMEHKWGAVQRRCHRFFSHHRRQHPQPLHQMRLLFPQPHHLPHHCSELGPELLDRDPVSVNWKFNPHAIPRFWSQQLFGYFDSSGVSGSIPPTFANLLNMQTVQFEGNSFDGPIPSAFLNLTSMTQLVLRNNNISDSIPSNIGEYQKLAQLDVSYNNLEGSVPSWVNDNNLQINLVANNFTIDSSNSRSSNNILYERENETLGPASFYVVDTSRWGVSNVGYFAGSNNPQYIFSSQSQFTNTLDSELFQTSRLSASSLRYYGLGLQNGNYNVSLQFTEAAIETGKTWKSLGRRVFDVYIQGNLVLKDFDILKAADGVSKRAVQKEFTAQVTENYMVIHLFWAGKGTCCIPDQDFIPTVSNKPPTTNNKDQTGLIVGVVVGAGGKLNDGRVIAVKKLSLSSHQGKKQFITEISTILAVQHRNLVKLYGCCIEGDNRLLVYEYLENKSLDQALFGEKSLNLDWPTRYDICLGVARGLAYLHEESRLRIVHRDVKASNVLLDSDLNPKISDFGLAKLYDDKKTHISTRYAMRGHLTEKADVFAFGVLALELISGRPSADSSLEDEKIYLLEWAWNLHEKIRDLELVDSRLSEFSEEEVKRIIGISLLCTQTSPVQRPSMSRVVAMLSGDIEVSHVTSKPGYLTDWNPNSDDTSSSFTSGNPTTGVVNSNYYSWTTISIGTDMERSPPNAPPNATNISHGR
ncbi:hypothetical protein Tsubulata_041371 [Turnera subulata]|uniref:non-specific serine/threonine protein kinase n=1 Tax=Turnera subulata TaxID=218843 RepID=A0A9Q0FVI0_9ROSI|nr:hypothetical protein Tsubulata_041371 [Turnera subulata]